jgi:phenylalanyl-tRNA synthetase beta chain
MLCAALVGASGPALFYEAKGIVDALPRVVQIGALSFAPGAAPWSEATATLAILHGDERVGTLGVVSARAKRLAGIRQAEAVLIELDVDALVPHASRENRYIALPRHPLVTKDVSVILDSSIRWEQLEALLADVTPALRKIEFVDEYIGPQVPADHRSLTLRLTLGADDHTLSRKEIDDAGALLTSCLEEALGGQIR